MNKTYMWQRALDIFQPTKILRKKKTSMKYIDEKEVHIFYIKKQGITLQSYNINKRVKLLKVLVS